MSIKMEEYTQKNSYELMIIIPRDLIATKVLIN